MNRKQVTKSRVVEGGRSKRAFLLLMVLIVVSFVTLAALSFSESMLLTFEETQIAGEQMQARLAAESGIDATRLFLTQSKLLQLESGGIWNNAPMFQAVNVNPSMVAADRCNYSILSPSLNESGSFGGVRYGLQNESALLNLNALVTIDQMLAGGADISGMMGGPDLSSMGLPSEFTAEAQNEMTGGLTENLGRNLLLGLPAMTPEIADAILDWLDEDDEPREYGAEREFYLQLPNPYEPTNGPLQSVEQLLLVRGVTPQLLFGKDQNRNGIVENQELIAYQQNLFLTGQAAANAAEPPALGWSRFLTLFSKEKNVTLEGLPRIDVNGEDLVQLQVDLEVLGNKDWETFVLAYRVYGGGGAAGGPGAPGGGQSIPPAASGLHKMHPTNDQFVSWPPASVRIGFDQRFLFQPAFPQRGGGGAPGGSGQQRGGEQRGGEQRGGGEGQRGQGRGGQRGGGQRGGGGRGNGPGAGRQGPGMQSPGVEEANGGGGNTTVPWSADFAEALDLANQSATGSIPQLLSLIDASFTVESNGQSITYTSPFVSDPMAMAVYLPVLMDKLTTVSSPFLPGRINIMEAPREILAGVPNLTVEVLDAVIEARQDGTESDNRNFETWLMVEGYLDLAQMRMLTPLLTCGGDVHRGQFVGYFEEGASFARIEATIDGVEPQPRVLTYRRLDHLGRGYTLPVLGQRLIGVTQ